MDPEDEHDADMCGINYRASDGRRDRVWTSYCDEDLDL